MKQNRNLLCLRAAAALLAAALLAGCAVPAATSGGAAGSTAAGSAAPTAAPTAGPEPSADPAATPAPADAIAVRVAAMSDAELVGQLFLVRPDSLDPALSDKQIDDASAAGDTALSDTMRATLERYPVGGVVLFGKNITGPEQLTAFLADLQQAAATPLLVGVDEEGGAVSRLANSPAFDLPQYSSVAAVGATGDPNNAFSMGETIGGYLKQYGFNLDFAPDADVFTNPKNTVIGTRAFSSDPAVAAEMVAAAVRGFHSAGVLCCLKHYPGHGDTSGDTHYGTAATDKTWQQLLDCELIPFKSGIAAGADLVMAAHISAQRVTDSTEPASLSKTLLTDKLRGELGFTGVIVTDSLAMQAITDQYSAGDAACKAISAGADLLLMPEDLPQAFDAVLAALQNGTIDRAQLLASVRRVLELKARCGLLSA